MRKKNWLRGYFAILFVLLFTVGTITFIIDPFFHYHKPIEGLYQYFNREPYQNPGMLKHFDYDTVILGSCMTENFYPSQFETLMGEHVVKASHQAAKVNNLYQYASMCLEQPNTLKIYWAIDIWTMEQDPDFSHDPVPEYLVDGNPLTDVNYLLNRDVFESYHAAILRGTITNSPGGMEYAWNWARSSRFSQDMAMSITKDGAASPLADYEQRIQNYEINLEDRILYLVENHPDVEFVFFYPPYSIRFWEEMLDNDIYYERIDRMKDMTGKLLDYDNVTIHNFQNQEELITNLWLYKDMMHYSDWVNDYMTVCFANGEYTLTKDNYIDEIDVLTTLVESFDYTIFENDLTRCTSYDAWQEAIGKGDYIILSVTSQVDPETGAGLLQILDNGNIVYEAYCGEKISYEYAGLIIEAKRTTGGADQGIWINGVKYSYCDGGINLVVYDKDLDKVLDAVYVSVADQDMTR